MSASVHLNVKCSYHHCNSFTVTHKVHVGLPAISLHDLRSGTRVVHGMSRHQVLTVWRPGQTQDMSGPATLRQKQKEMRVEPGPVTCDRFN